MKDKRVFDAIRDTNLHAPVDSATIRLHAGLQAAFPKPADCRHCAGSVTGQEPPGMRTGTLTFRDGEEYAGPNGVGRKCPECGKLYLLIAMRLD